MSPFLRKNIAFGVASSLAFAVGQRLWGLAGLLAPLEAGLPGSLATSLTILLGGLTFLAGAAVFVWVYMFINGKLEDMAG
jgi:hypothetical protein